MTLGATVPLRRARDWSISCRNTRPSPLAHHQCENKGIAFYLTHFSMTRLIASLLAGAGFVLSQSVAAQTTVTTPVVPSVAPVVAPAVTPAAPTAPAVAAPATPAPKAEPAAAPKAEKKAKKPKNKKKKSKKSKA
jgi:hypothetical protein